MKQYKQPPEKSNSCKKKRSHPGTIQPQDKQHQKGSMSTFQQVGIVTGASFRKLFVSGLRFAQHYGIFILKKCFSFL
jgi:hypothetical protein